LRSCNNLQAKSPKGDICAAYSLAFSLLACRNAHLAAIPCMMTLLRKTPNESPQRDSWCGLHRASSAYQSMHRERVGRPSVEAEEAKAGLVRGSRSLVGRCRANVNGERRLERSERGCPSVDISQLKWHRLVSKIHSCPRTGAPGGTYSRIPITLGFVRWNTRLSIL